MYLLSITATACKLYYNLMNKKTFQYLSSFLGKCCQRLLVSDNGWNTNQTSKYCN